MRPRVPTPTLRAPDPSAPAVSPAARFVRAAAKAVLRFYLRSWHSLKTEGVENLPPHGPALVLSNHASILDVMALMSIDPYADTALVAKASLFRIPVVKQVLEAWGAIPVERQGRDVAGVRALMGILRAGRVIAVAAEGRRTRVGRLEPINPVLARIAVTAQVPLVPIGISGSYAALPPGAVLPRRLPIVIRVGQPFHLPRETSPAEAAQRIRDEIAALLNPDQRPTD